MATDKNYLNYVKDQLSGLPDVGSQAMMGEYLLRVRGRIVGGLYDDRLLVKPTASALRLLPDAPRELPYEGGKEMLLVEEIEDKAFLRTLVERMACELPAPKGSKAK